MNKSDKAVLVEIFMQAISGKIGIDEVPDEVEVNGELVDIDSLSPKAYLLAARMLREFNNSSEQDWDELQRKWIKRINNEI